MDLIFILGLFFICLVLMAIEIFLIPGTSIAGILAAICLLIANFFCFDSYGLVIGMCSLAGSLFVCGGMAYWMAHSKFFDRISLKTEIDSTAATQEQLSVHEGDEGIALTRLALVGNANINGKEVEVKSASGFLDAGTAVIVSRINDGQIIVKEALQPKEYLNV